MTYNYDFIFFFNVVEIGFHRLTSDTDKAQTTCHMGCVSKPTELPA